MKNLDIYGFVTSLKTKVMHFICNYRKKFAKDLEKKIIFVGTVKATDKKSRIRIRIQFKICNPVYCMDPWIRIRVKISWIQNAARYLK